MTRKVATQGAIESDDDERNDDDRQDGVRQKNREVDRANDARALKARRTVVVVINEVRSQKE